MGRIALRNRVSLLRTCYFFKAKDPFIFMYLLFHISYTFSVLYMSTSGFESLRANSVSQFAKLCAKGLEEILYGSSSQRTGCDVARCSKRVRRQLAEELRGLGAGRRGMCQSIVRTRAFACVELTVRTKVLRAWTSRM